MSNSLNAMMLSAKLEEVLLGERAGNLSRIVDMPWLTLPPGYSFKVTFPFCGAAARFRVCKTERPDRDVSVYLDTQDVLGYVGEPYWEAYPIGDDTGRFLLGETEELVASIVAELERDQPSPVPDPA